MKNLIWSSFLILFATNVYATPYVTSCQGLTKDNQKILVTGELRYPNWLNTVVVSNEQGVVQSTVEDLQTIPVAEASGFLIYGNKIKVKVISPSWEEISKDECVGVMVESELSLPGQDSIPVTCAVIMNLNYCPN